MKFLTFLLIISIFVSCQKTTIKIENFDRLEHYQLNDVDNINDNSILKQILFGEVINHLSDTIFIDQLPIDVYQKKSVNSNKNLLKELITSNQNSINNSKCLTIYRDIILLKQKNKTIGICKICFDCGIISYIDNNSKTELLLTNENNSLLENLLK